VTVCAVCLSADPRIVRAVETQSRPPDRITAQSAGSWPGTDWLWLVDGSAVPRPDALGALLDAADRLGGLVDVLLLSSRIVAADGRLDALHAPIAPQGQTDVALRTVAQRVLHVRAVTGGSLLVRASGVSDLPSAGAPATMAWTARLLRDRHDGGFLVPESVADAVPDPSASRTAVARRLLTGDALTARERIRLAAELVELKAPALRRARARARRP